MLANQAKIESLLFTSGEDGITVTQLAQIIGVLKPAVFAQLAKLKQKYAEDATCSFELKNVEERYYLATKPAFAPLLQQYFAGPAVTTLSKAALETLAVIAYQQPATRLQVEEVRGVAAGNMIQRLVNFGLIKEAGRIEAPGRPIVYRTTDKFLQHFGIKDLSQLPELNQPEEQDRKSVV